MLCFASLGDPVLSLVVVGDPTEMEGCTPQYLNLGSSRSAWEVTPATIGEWRVEGGINTVFRSVLLGTLLPWDPVGVVWTGYGMQRFLKFDRGTWAAQSIKRETSAQS